MELTISDARAMVTAQKFWAGTDFMWVPNGARLPGYTFRAALAMPDGRQPESLFVSAFFKHSAIAGASDKLYLNLFYKSHLILGWHDNSPSRHINRVGIGEVLYHATVAHPHRHRVCDESVEGYAEPLPRTPPDQFWSGFLRECNIENGPSWVPPPPTQPDLL